MEGLGRNVIVSTCITIAVLVSLSSGQADGYFGIRPVGAHVRIQTTASNETFQFEKLLKAHAHSKQRISNFMDFLKQVTNVAGVSKYCQSDTDLLKSDANYSAVYHKYIDASAKIPFGIMQGKWNWVGDYQECHSIDSIHNPHTRKSFKGKYSSAVLLLNQKLVFGTNTIILGLCFPDSCSETDVVLIGNELIQILKLVAAQIDPDIAKQNLSIYESFSDEQEQLDGGAVAVVAITGVIGMIVFLATLMDYGYNTFAQAPKKNVHVNDDASSVDNSDRTGLLSGDSCELFAQNFHEGIMYRCKQRLLDICRVFSIFSNGKKLFGTATAVGPLSCLNGIRVLSMWWVILGHTYFFITSVVDNAVEVYTILQRFSFQPILNGTFSVDSFFFLSGLLVAYLSLKEIREKGRLSWPYYFLHRYWRLTPLYAYVILYYTFLFSSTISGPSRYIVAQPGFKQSMDICKTHWWTNLLYINNMYPNYGNIETTCLGWSWYLANDMQFFLVLGPLVILTLSFRGRHKYVGICVTVMLILAGAIVCGSLVVYYGIYDLSGTATKHTSDPWFKALVFYDKPYARFPVYLVGMLTGYIISSSNNRIRMHRAIAAGGWCVAIATALSVIFGQYYYNSHPGTHMTLLESVFYVSLSRTAWGLCLAWVVIACVSGYGGPVNDILSWTFWAPLGRLTYAAYLVHPIVINTYYYNMPQPLHFSDLTMVYLFISNLVVSYLVAFIVSMMVEAPMIQLEKLLLAPIGSFCSKYVLSPLRWLSGKMAICFQKLR